MGCRLGLSAKRTGYAIFKGLYFDKIALEDLVGLRCNFNEAVPTWEGAERGISILLCMIRSLAATQDARLRDDAAYQTEANRQFDEALNLTAKDPRASPIDLDTFAKLVATYAAFLDTCFTISQKLMSISKMWLQFVMCLRRRWWSNCVIIISLL